jgi:hypothetical protein
MMMPSTGRAQAATPKHHDSPHDGQEVKRVYHPDPNFYTVNGNRIHLPTLYGSGKQVKWALDIRRRTINGVMACMYAADEYAGEDMTFKALPAAIRADADCAYTATTTTAARDIIDRREHLYRIAATYGANNEKAAPAGTGTAGAQR